MSNLFRLDGGQFNTRASWKPHRNPRPYGQRLTRRPEHEASRPCGSLQTCLLNLQCEKPESSCRTFSEIFRISLSPGDFRIALATR